MIRINIPRFTAPTAPGVTTRISSPKPRMPSGIGRPSPMAIRQPQPRFKGTAPGKVQNVINRILGATPEQPIRIPVQWGKVEVKADKTIQNTALLLGGLGLLGVILYANR